MANFSYQAINENGTNVSGAIQADSAENAENLLLSRGYIPTKVVASARRAGSTSLLERINQALGQVKIGDLILFSKQFRSMMQAGIPIIRLLTVLENQTENTALKKAVAAIGQDIRGGSTLHDAMKKHPAIFSSLYLSMINAGEISGTIPEVMERLIGIIEHEAKIKSDIKSALQYPIIVTIALGIAFFVLLAFVIPKFAGIFAKAGLSLPMPTQIAIVLHHFLIGHWLIILAAVIGVIAGLHFWFKTEGGQFARDTFILRLPLFGPLLQKAALSRFASIFAILQSSGVPVIQALEVLSGTIGNTAIARQFDIVREKVKEGQGISGPLGSAKYFTPMVVDMVAIGEESGNIDEMLRQISLHYDDEVAYAVKGLSDALGPILIVGLASVVGFFALAIFMPMWDMTKMTQMK
jgi:type II secretory pathway component PulF